MQGSCWCVVADIFGFQWKDYGCHWNACVRDYSCFPSPICHGVRNWHTWHTWPTRCVAEEIVQLRTEWPIAPGGRTAYANNSNVRLRQVRSWRRRPVGEMCHVPAHRWPGKKTQRYAGAGGAYAEQWALQAPVAWLNKGTQVNGCC